ncbi:antitoxin Xre-like helix-turn-helix domain-containing protein [Halofilum ochraceum]|uniref:antitoxin Xre-like helix-turn-helix domain-containing protein n=1 Tax=Halofilum ochraceum TaxID=1611323 RepID=UPI0008D8F6C9|nr:antitoxin Xre-like helix-turn-helix domain-containing protein [Halofilum ochraceum]
MEDGTCDDLRKWHTRLVAGMSGAEAQRLLRQTGLKDAELAYVLGISVSTLRRRFRQRRLRSHEGDCLYRLTVILGAAPVAWLRQAQPDLDGLRPLEVIRTEVGYELIRDMLAADARSGPGMEPDRPSPA